MKNCPEDRCFKLAGHHGPHEAGNGVRWTTGGTRGDRPTGIKWTRTGDTVTGTVIVIDPNGAQSEVATVRYTLEQAAQMATQLISAMGGKS